MLRYVLNCKNVLSVNGIFVDAAGPVLPYPFTASCSQDC